MLTCSLPMSSEGVARCFVVYPPTIQNVVCLFDFGFLNFRKWAVGDTLAKPVAYFLSYAVPIKCMYIGVRVLYTIIMIV